VRVGWGPGQDYLDPNNPRYAPKLAAAVRAWIAADGNSAGHRSPKYFLRKWLIPLRAAPIAVRVAALAEIPAVVRSLTDSVHAANKTIKDALK
jgi:hypothetical protein